MVGYKEIPHAAITLLVDHLKLCNTDRVFYARCLSKIHQLGYTSNVFLKDFILPADYLRKRPEANVKVNSTGNSYGFFDEITEKVKIRQMGHRRCFGLSKQQRLQMQLERIIRKKIALNSS